MNFLEKDLEQIIWDTDALKLENRGLSHIKGIRKRQLRIGNYGILDLLTIRREETPNGQKYLSLTVFELKKEHIDSNTFLQAVRYCKGISNYLMKRNFYNFELSIVLVGKNINKNSSFVFLSDMLQGNEFPDFGGISRVSFYTYSYEFDGIKFIDQSGYKLTNEGF